MIRLEQRPLTNSSRTPNEEQPPVVLQPVQPILAGSTPSTAIRFVKPTRSLWNKLAVLTVVGVVVAFWFLVAQNWIIPDPTSTESSNLTPGNQSKDPPNADEATTPFQDVQLERAQQEAQVVIDEFTKIQDSLEKNQYGNEAQLDVYREILARANNGDVLFGQRQFDKAIAEYERALQEIRQLLDDMDSEFTHWFEQGETALANRDYDTALLTLARAQAIEPLNSDVEQLLTRVQLLPQINELIRESSRAQIKEEWVQALDLLDDVVQLDPFTQGVSERREFISEQIRIQELHAALTVAHAHLAAAEFDAAEQAFTAVLTDHPENIPAQTGLRRVERARLTATFEALRVRAREKEAELDLPAALQIYDEALALDSSLQFATEGRQRVFEIISVIREMNDALGDPHALSADETYEQAKSTLATAQTHRGHSADFDALFNDFSNLVRYAGTQLRVILVSDNATDVTLTTRHSVGVFDRHELMLRPGRYTLHGSRDGWVDVRKTFVVQQDMEPILIVCEEQI